MPTEMFVPQAERAVIVPLTFRDHAGGAGSHRGRWRVRYTDCLVAGQYLPMVMVDLRAG